MAHAGALSPRIPSLPLSCYCRAMGDEKAFAALGRIERALARIEAAAARPAAAPAADDALRDAHEALRGKVETAIRQIDQLLMSAEHG